MTHSKAAGGMARPHRGPYALAAARSRRRAALLLSATYIVHAALFLPLTRAIGPPPALAPALALAIAAGWVGGCAWGTIAGLLTLPLSCLGLFLMPPPDAFPAVPWSLDPMAMGVSPRVFLFATSTLVSLGITGIAAVIGRLRDLGAALRAERIEVETLLRATRTSRDLLAEREALLGMALEVSGIGYWTYHLESGTMTWSPGLYRILGEDADRAPSIDALRRHASAQDSGRLDGLVQRVSAGKTVANAEYRMVRLDGNERWVFGGCEVMQDETGRPAKVIGTLQDLTDHRQLQAQLARAERMAAVGQLAAGVAHRVNSPLAAVATNLRCLERDLCGVPDSLSPGTAAELGATIQDAQQAAERVRLIMRELMAIGTADAPPHGL